MDICSLLFVVWFISLLGVLVTFVVKWERYELSISVLHGFICALTPVLNSVLFIWTILKVLFYFLKKFIYGWSDFWDDVRDNF